MSDVSELVKRLRAFNNLTDDGHDTRIAAADAITALQAENERLNRIINSPETEDFMKGVPLEATHQVERWGKEHDAAKNSWDWFWTCGYLAQKAATSDLADDLVKAKHHTITTAALMLNWHRHLSARAATENGKEAGDG